MPTQDQTKVQQLEKALKAGKKLRYFKRLQGLIPRTHAQCASYAQYGEIRAGFTIR